MLGEGEIKQVGTPEQIFRKPNSVFVARFTMMRNIFTGELRRRPDGSVTFKTGDIEFRVALYQDGVRHACIRPDNIAISSGSPLDSGSNSFLGTVTRIVDSGLALQVTVRVPPDFCCLVTHRDRADMDLAEGKQVSIAFRPESVHLF